MPTTSPVILILGAGANIGHHVARTFAAKGYKVALAARRLKETDNTPDRIHIPSDLSDPSSVLAAFAKTKSLLGSSPSVVVYNAAAFTPAADSQNPLSIPLADFTRDLNINTTSVFVAAQQAVLGFEQLGEEAARTFIFTGNILNEVVMVKLLDAGMGKTATAHLVRAASEVYKGRGYKFYYGDERKADGSAKFNVDGEAHAELYLGLAEGKEQRPWQQTFVKGVGYKKFPVA
ncbi:hypothetical protein EG329_002646 [Mollisiaceae sp. DMI_Dod_QoI]|nr:hypothetical protein EG329_002646 [Helotiales sp. DMI_Dod_QoI]